MPAAPLQFLSRARFRFAGSRAQVRASLTDRVRTGWVQDALKAAGVDEVLVYCVNDGAVMDAWAADQGIEGSMITFLGDPNSTLTTELDMILDHEGVVDVLGPGRCKRFAAILDDGVIKSLFVSEAEGDPAGGDDPSLSCVDNILANLA